jgi:hypothetical protein
MTGGLCQSHIGIMVPLMWLGMIYPSLLEGVSNDSSGCCFCCPCSAHLATKYIMDLCCYCKPVYQAIDGPVHNYMQV